MTYIFKIAQAGIQTTDFWFSFIYNGALDHSANAPQSCININSC